MKEKRKHIRLNSSVKRFCLRMRCDLYRQKARIKWIRRLLALLAVAEWGAR
jgi:hypothetical protein